MNICFCNDSLYFASSVKVVSIGVNKYINEQVSYLTKTKIDIKLQYFYMTVVFLSYGFLIVC